MAPTPIVTTEYHQLTKYTQFFLYIYNNSLLPIITKGRNIFFHKQLPNRYNVQ